MPDKKQTAKEVQSVKSKEDREKITNKGAEEIKIPNAPDQGFVFYEE